MKVLTDIIRYHIFTVILASLLLSCGDGSETLPPKTGFDPTDQTTDEDSPSSSKESSIDSTGSTTDTTTGTTTSTSTHRNSKNQLKPTIVANNDTPDLQSDATRNTSASKTEKKSDISSNIQNPIAQDDKQEVTSQYHRPFISSPYPSEYKEKLDNSGTLSDQLRPFVKEMTTVMEMAKQDKSRAKDAFERLRVCALAKPADEIFSVRASCAENLRTLTKLYPNEFSKKYAEIEKEFPKDIKDSLLF